MDDFELTPPPTRIVKAIEPDTQEEMFSGSEMFQIGSTPIIGREVAPGEEPLFSAIEDDEEQAELFTMPEGEGNP